MITTVCAGASQQGCCLGSLTNAAPINDGCQNECQNTSYTTYSILCSAPVTAALKSTHLSLTNTCTDGTIPLCEWRASMSRIRWEGGRKYNI